RDSQRRLDHVQNLRWTVGEMAPPRMDMVLLQELGDEGPRRAGGIFMHQQAFFRDIAGAHGIVGSQAVVPEDRTRRTAPSTSASDADALEGLRSPPATRNPVRRPASARK